MSSHTCLPGHPGVLADDCERCDEQARQPMLLGLDNEKTATLWNKMIAVEINHTDNVVHVYSTDNEAKAAHQFYLLGIWLERRLGIDPWVPFVTLQERLRP